MPTKERENFVIQVSPENLARLRAIARDEGRELQSLIDEALSDLIAKRGQQQRRSHVMLAYQASHDTFATLYRKLAG